MQPRKSRRTTSKSERGKAPTPSCAAWAKFAGYQWEELGKENEEGRSCAENGIKLYTKIGTQPLAGTIFSQNSHEFLRRMYPAKSALSSNSCAFAMNINLSPRRTVTFSVQPYSILAFRQVSSAAKATSYISGTSSWILRMERSDQRTCPGCFPDLQMVITNTFRHSWDKPRFRVVFFTNEIMTPEVYGLIYGWIADKLEEAGYSVDRNDKKRKPSGRSNTRPSGLDSVRRAPASSIFPAKRKSSKTASLTSISRDGNP